MTAAVKCSRGEREREGETGTERYKGVTLKQGQRDKRRQVNSLTYDDDITMNLS